MEDILRRKTKELIIIKISPPAYKELSNIAASFEPSKSIPQTYLYILAYLLGKPSATLLR
jgi:hypothetical protein